MVIGEKNIDWRILNNKTPFLSYKIEVLIQKNHEFNFRSTR